MVDQPSVRFGLSQKGLAVLGIAAVAVILFAVATLTIVNLRQTSDRLESLARETTVGDAYSTMLTSIAEAGGYTQQFQDTRDPQYAGLTLAAIRAALNAEAQINALGNAEDRALMASLEQQYGSQLALAQQILANPSLLGSQPGGEVAFPLADIAAALATPTLEKRDLAAAHLESLQNGFDSRSNAILVAFAVSLPLLALLAYLIVRYERQEAVRVEELGRMGRAALTDYVTGLGNHRAFQDDLKREQARAARTEQPLSVAIMDIDDFKVTNDSYGHARGDQVLAELGRLLSYMRAEDRSYRVGGDEFALIMTNTDAKAALEALDRLRTTVATALEGITISVGVTSNLGGDLTAAGLVENADLALYEAKHQGKNQVVSYDFLLTKASDVTTSKMKSLLEVIRSGEVKMLFQPIYRPFPQELLGYEALLRLPQAPELSGPEEAFVIAQHMGRSRDLDRLCTGSALDAARDLPPGVKIFINLDPATLIHSEFSALELLAVARDRGIDPSTVVFEVTERTTVPLSRLATQVNAIKQCGFEVALDDVGAGNSGLEMMRVIKFDYVKIDRTVILDAMNGGPGRAIILAIVAFARETGAFMIAEGIENREMLESVKFDGDGLTRFWVQGVQGFLFGEPQDKIAATAPGRQAA